MQIELQQVVEQYKIKVSELSHELLLTQIALSNLTKELEQLQANEEA